MEDCDGVESVVKALNCVEEGKVKGELVAWVHQCIAWFNEQNVGVLIQNQGSVVNEYRALALIEPEDSQRMVLLEDFYNSLCNKIGKEFVSGEVYLLEALEYALHVMDSRVYSGNHDSLNKLGDKLLAKLAPSMNDFSKGTYPSIRSLLLALHRVLVLIQQIAGSNWDPSLENGIYSAFRKRVKQISQSAEYYPVVYHTCLLEQALQRLELKKSQSQTRDTFRRVFQGAKGIAYLYTAARALVVLEFDVSSLADACESLQAAFQREHIKKESWYDLLQAMNHVSLSCIEDSSEFELFQQGFDIFTSKKSSSLKEHQRKALFYTIVTQLSVLAWNGHTSVIRKASMQKLSMLADECKFSERGVWSHDASLVEVLLRSLVDVYVEGEEEVKTMAKAALKVLEDIAHEPVQETQWYNRLTQEEAGVSKVMLEWLGAQDLESKLSNIVDTVKSPPAKILFKTISIAWKENIGFNSQFVSNDLPNLQQALKEYYTQPYFSQVPSIFEGRETQTVGSLQYKIMCKVQNVSAEPTSLEDLFVSKSLNPNESGQDIQRILLLGKPGSGKTTLSHKLAHDWAKGELLQMLQAVFVLRVRDLENFKKDEDLSTAIALECFLTQSGDDHDLVSQIKQELEKPTTLVVLDGLDERSEESKRLIRQAFLGQHKLLALSRAHGIEQERSLVDREVQLIGLGEKQMEAYVRHNLSSESEQELQAYLNRQPAVKAIAHIPMNLEILCTLWNDGSAFVREEAMKGSLAGLYRCLTRYIWEHFARERSGIDLKEQGEVFTLLGEVALRALERKQSKIGQGLVDSVLEERLDFRDKLKDSGFLTSGKGHYEFLHQTFQEYFAARVLAKRLQSNESSARRFISKHKYDPNYRIVFSFLAGEASRNGVEGLEKLLSLVDEDPHEVVGVQHICLQMKILSEWLCAAEEHFVEEELESLEDTFGIIDTYNRWLSKGICQVKPDEYSIGEGMNLLAVLLEEFEGFRIVAKYNQELMEILKEVCTAAEKSVRILGLEALGGVVRIAPDCGSDVVDTLMTVCKDSEWTIRRCCVIVLGEIVKFDPSSGPAVTDALLAACEDPASVVADAALKVLENIVKVASDCAKKVIDTLVIAPKNSELDVHPNALKVFKEALQAVPDCGKNVVQTLVASCRGPESKAHKNTLIFLGETVQVVPDLAVKAIETVEIASTDPTHEARKTALDVLGIMVEINSDCAARGMDILLSANQDSDWGICNAAMRALARIAVVIPDSVVTIVEAMIQACEDPERISRTAALNTLGQVVRVHPGCAGKGIDAILVACKNPKWSVRRNAFTVLRDALKVSPKHTLKVIDTLKSACMDPAWKVRDAALSVISDLLKATPECSIQVVDLLVAACKDSEQVVRDGGLKILGNVVKEDPNSVVKAVDILFKFCKDTELGDIENTLRAFKVILGVAPEYGLELADILIAACEDLPQGSRRNVLDALQGVVKASPACAECVVDTLIAACSDPDPTIRLAALSSLGEIVRFAPKCTSKVIDPFIASCVDSDWRVCNAGMRGLSEVVMVAPECASKVMCTLISACEDAERVFHTKALSVVGKVVTLAPDCAADGVGALIAASKSTELQVCKSALSILGEVVESTPDFAIEIVDILAAACTDSEDSVRKAALGILGNIVKVSPNYLKTSLNAVLAACEDPEWGVCNTALRVLIEVVKVAPESALRIIDALVSACKDHERVAHTTILTVLGEIARIVPNCVVNGMDAVIAACMSPKWGVRRSALETLRKIVKVYPKCIDKTLDMLGNACKDLNWKVSEAALKVIGEAVNAAPECAPHFMDPLIAACENTEWAVSGAAVVVLGEAVKAAPHHMGQVLQALQGMEKNAGGMKKILSVLNTLPIQDIIKSCWTTQNTTLIDLTRSKLYHIALTMEKKRSSKMHLVMYLSASTVVAWDKPYEEAEHFRQMVQCDIE